MQTPTKHALNQTCSIQVQRVQASLEGKDVIAATAIKKQAEGHRYMFPPLDIWLSTTVMSCALKTPDQALTWTFHFTQIQDSTASVARQFFYSCQPVRLLVNDRKFPAGNSVFLSHQTSQQ